jgi:hypothetical protein
MVKKVSVLTADGRTIELRVRSRRRVAVRADQLPPAPKMYLMCDGARVELRLTWDKPIHGFYVYYVPAEDYCVLTSVLEKAHKAAPCVLYTEHV